MMKKIILFSLLLISATVFSQTQETVKTSPEDRSKYVPEDAKPAEYPGGIAAFSNTVASKIKANRIKGVKGKIHSNARFAVNINGDIEKITVTGENVEFNREVERAITSVKTKWTPAEYKGYQVLTWYNLPFILNFD
ncbi:hypothetical protein [Chryseobacterium sp. W4I1]|uniref:hypothetical protein n=1 Tax=Chryseobacterium sp. W4I1 TaxID=3042293 RepID=UPI00277E07E4|nr:hypothetical protein [Chryseobacterium sp. W4I1]MDQ0783907.1 hypothetical protein [Chryseobacterium sp. W4I1]